MVSKSQSSGGNASSKVRTARYFAPVECPACGESADRRLNDDLRLGDEFLVQRCGDCGHQVLRFCPPLAFEGDDEFGPVILERYIRAMKQARQAAARTLLDAVARHLASKTTLLDVGASFGWLVAEANQAGWQAEGIEPSSIAGDYARRAGAAVAHGFFPEDLPRGQRWQVITLMDVLEHLERPSAILLAIRDRLQPGGLLALQVPNSRGLFLRVSRTAARLTGGRLSGPLLRMYQTQFPYPHLHYFHPGNLRKLLERVGFDVLSLRTTRTIAGAVSDRIGYLKPEYAGLPSAGVAAKAVVAAGAGINLAARLTGLHDTFYCIARPV